MRINCAACGKAHKSAVEPFKYDVIPDAKANTIGSIKEKVSESEFVCRHCGITNYISFRWYAAREKWMEGDNENQLR